MSERGNYAMLLVGRLVFIELVFLLINHKNDFLGLIKVKLEN